MKKAPNDTDLLLHPSENEDPKELPDLLAFKSCTAYMGNLKIMFMDKFRENKPPLVFHREIWSRILSAILNMKTIYYRKHNIRLVNTKQRAGQWNIYIYIYIYIYVQWNVLLLWWFCASYCYRYSTMISSFWIFHATFMLLMIIIYTYWS